MISPVSKISTSQSITKISTGLQCGSTSLRRKSLFGTLKAGSRRMHFIHKRCAQIPWGDEYAKTFPDRDLLQWLEAWTIEDLSDESPQQANDFDCGIFTLLNLCLLVEEGSITKDSYTQTTIQLYAKEVRNVIAHILWNASSNLPEAQAFCYKRVVVIYLHYQNELLHDKHISLSSFSVQVSKLAPKILKCLFWIERNRKPENEAGTLIRLS